MNDGSIEGIATPISTPPATDTAPAADTVHPAEIEVQTSLSSEDVVAAVVAALKPALERLNRDVENLYSVLNLRRPE